MKKLRLIKPWRLRATRLKLADVQGRAEYTEISYAACAAPGDSDAGNRVYGRFESVDIHRCAYSTAPHCFVHTGAPASQILNTRGITLPIR